VCAQWSAVTAVARTPGSVVPFVLVWRGGAWLKTHVGGDPHHNPDLGFLDRDPRFLDVDHSPDPGIFYFLLLFLSTAKNKV